MNSSDVVSSRVNEPIIPFKLLILEVDGVLTPHAKYYDVYGDVMGKSFNVRDFSAIHRFEHEGVKVCFLADDWKVTEPLAQARGIDFYCTGPYAERRTKESYIPEFVNKYDIAVGDMAFVGCDTPDLALMGCLTYAYCPNDAAGAVKDAAIVLNSGAGEGVVVELYDLVMGWRP